MQKSYFEFMKEISSEELYCGLLAHGLFSEKLPPVFTSENFYDYCETKQPSFKDKRRQYIFYENMRNINTPRPLGIPSPMAYQHLCRCLADNWGKLCEHFNDMTAEQSHKVSRIHIRKLSGNSALFEMNYKNWKADGSPEPDLLIGKRWIVKADISNCFPSIYTHSLPWALVGKKDAKDHKDNKKEWFNKIDHFSQNIKNGETHGLLIGPHTSNLLSEIILTSIDNELTKIGWKYIRNIDDYTCYVSDYEDGQRFLADLNRWLRYFDLALNHKKTEIVKLAITADKSWVRQIGSMQILPKSEILNYKEVRAYLDHAIELAHCNDSDASILNYALKVLSSRSVTENAKAYIVKTILHWAVLYPYLIPLLNEYVFEKFSINKDDIIKFTNDIFAYGIKRRNYEAASYALFFAIKYEFKIEDISIEDIIESDNTVLMLLAYKYFELSSDPISLKLKEVAEKLEKDKDIDRHWLFVYEALPESKLQEEWKAMKKAGVSFLKSFKTDAAIKAK
ncbi:MAG: RNA-directed DNA polymerase [Helicobacteraceae bacterium]|jgi:hypothetical protein|nr:RNA-directed DNA polymerase [Helicobacteraceae bacterium]